nr:iron chelate uptake ABC transporter family permease subunit [Streptomyces lonarensis]
MTATGGRAARPQDHHPERETPVRETPANLGADPGADPGATARPAAVAPAGAVTLAAWSGPDSGADRRADRDAAPTRTAHRLHPADEAAAVATIRGARLRVRARTTAVVLVLAAAVTAAFALAVGYGDMVVPLPDLIAILTGGGSGGPRFVVMELRLPRALLALTVGIAFGLAGAVFQTLLRNPLASPDVIGISAGASATAVTATLTFGVSGFALSLSALGGAFVTAALIYGLAWRQGVSGYRLVLVGIGIAAGLASVISYQLTSSRVTEAQSALVWLTGSLNGRSWNQFVPLAISLAVLLPLTALVASRLRALQLGDDAAGGLGVRVEAARLALIACGVALAGVATAAAGPVAFVAFVSAPIARRLLPGRGAALVPAALVGALIVLLADFAAQHLISSVQLPVGVATSIIGAPYLLWLLARNNKEGSGG